MSNTSTQGYGTLASQPMMADSGVYFAFEVSKTSITPHDLIVFRGNNPIALREFRDRTRKFMTKHDPNFKSSLIPVREDNLGRGCLYTVVPVYNGLRADLKAQLTKHFYANEMTQWVNTAADPIQRPTDKPKDRVVKVVNPVDYTKKRIDRTEMINGYLKQPIGSLTELCRQRELTPSWSKVSMAACLADWDIRHGQVTITDEAILATEPEELPSVPVTVEPPQRRLLPDFNQMTKAQLLKLAGQNGVALKRSMPKSEMITRLIESVQ